MVLVFVLGTIVIACLAELIKVYFFDKSKRYFDFKESISGYKSKK